MAKNNFRNTDRDNKGGVVKKKTTQIAVSYNIPEVDDNVKGCSTVNSTSVNEYSGDIIYNVGTEESDAVVVGCNSNNDNSSESLAFSPIREKNNNVQSTDIWKELDKANHKRHLKNLKRFLTNREIVTAAVERCLKRASKSKHRNKAIKHKEEIINRIIDELTN